MENWFDSNGVEVTLNDPENFLKIRETLTRIGIASKGKENKLYQSCHILHKKGKYGIVHFKELFALDGKFSDFDEEDRSRRNVIARLLEQWNLVTIVNKKEVENLPGSINQVKIISHKEKSDWTLVEKYSIGKKVKKLEE
jgi:hypothetical protein